MKYENIQDLAVGTPYQESGVWECEVFIKRADGVLAVLCGRSANEAKKMANATAYMMNAYYAQFGLQHLTKNIKKQQ